jgi:hypothetical protein
MKNKINKENGKIVSLISENRSFINVGLYLSLFRNMSNVPVKIEHDTTNVKSIMFLFLYLYAKVINNTFTKKKENRNN